MKPPSVGYARVDSVDEALEVLAEHGDEAKVLAGGQSLIPLLNMRLASPGILVDVNRLDALTGMREDGDMMRIGAMVRQSTLESPLIGRTVPLVAQCVPHIGHFVTRNRGTVGGSIAHADPRSELPLVLAALGGSATVASRQQRREIAAEDLFVTYFTTPIEADELLVDTVWPAAGRGWGYAFEEFSLRHGDYALAMVACALQRAGGAVSEARIAVGAVTDRPVLLTAVGGSLLGSAVDDEVAAEVGRLAGSAVDVDDDMHASAGYRRHLVGVLTRRAVTRAWRDAEDRGS